MIAAIINEIASIKQRKSELKKFGIIFFVIGVSLAGLVFYKQDLQVTKLTIIFGTLGLLFLIAGLFFPLILKSIHKIWMILAIILGYFTSNFILLLLFFLFITPTAIILRLARKDILDLKNNTGQKTLWKNYTKATGKERYEKMF